MSRHQLAPHRKLTKRDKQRLLPFAAFELTASTIALTDILHAQSVRHGNKLLWALLAFVQPIGPWLYFLFGQERE
ncbi:PLD nuclease N-terminal domain-containing protein [Levilactobacillus suantsaii]|uniref:PLDc_N domain-containing protein n=1 Tax=Levilactobacillus suantsaii TaxID=2292255 RepID=A0A4Q0VIP9_9LACO|nr:PLD nuclease N-terminal domain-containing protein [Levilactobacillus suantsaii]QMU08817.1 PLDc_N domain-containing protein [Levilactobacillus suantsaii]RXI76703.1 PLDc_N domain-containing protein [Levilactobacillus suantsaii]